MRFRYIIAFVLTLIVYKTSAQEKSDSYEQRIKSYLQNREVYAKPFKETANLRIGKQLPDFGSLKLINSAESTINLSNYKDRLLILDFWGSTCGACIDALPHMEALQKKFGDKIKIQPINAEKQSYILEWWKKNKLTKELSLTSVVEAFDLQSYFEHRAQPHEVWVYKGKVIGITAGEYVDAYNIQQVLAGKTPNWPTKNEHYVYDISKPLFRPNPSQIDTVKTFIKYAAIADYKEKDGVSLQNKTSEIIRDQKNKTIRVSILNNPIYSIYGLQWMKLIRVSELVIPSGSFEKAVLWEVADRSKYKYESGQKDIYGYEGDWMRKHSICFESVNPDTGQTDQAVAKTVISDLNRLLGLNVRWEKRKEKILVLVRTTKEDKLKSKTVVARGDQYHNESERETIKGNLHQFRGYPLGPLVYSLNKQEENPYVFNETGYEGEVDMDLNFSSWTDITGIRKALQPYGLDLKEEERLVDRFVFSEVSGGLLVDKEMESAAIAKKVAQADMKNPSAEENTAFMEANKKQPGVITLPSGLQYKIIKQGNGAKPLLNDKVKVNYTGTLVNGKIFINSLETGRPADLRVNGVIAGWKEALQLMPVGSKWIIYIPASLAYEEHTGKGAVPANSNLIFELDLLNIIK